MFSPSLLPSALFVAVVLSSSSPSLAAPPKKAAAATLADRKVDNARVERVLASLTLRERLAQLVLAYPQLRSDTPVEVGGLLFVGNALKKLDKAREKIDSSNRRAKVPPFVAVDIEGGSFNRLKAHPTLRALPIASEMAALSDAQVQEWGRKVGQVMRENGLNMNLAPVLDVAASGHMFKNKRAFSGEPEVVVAKASAYARGMLEAGVVAVGKHFPGYGDLSADTDHELAHADWQAAKIDAQAAVFARAAPVLGGVMMSNIAYKALGEAPAILDSQLVDRAHALGLLAMTDDVAIPALMQAVNADSAEVLRRAFLAGNDLLLSTSPPDWDKGMDPIGVLVKLVGDDPQRKAQADTACRRVLGLKDRMGLLDGK